MFGKLKVHRVYQWMAFDNVKANREIRILSANKRILILQFGICWFLWRKVLTKWKEKNYIVLNWWKMGTKECKKNMW